jgi:hypothetical protein
MNSPYKFQNPQPKNEPVVRERYVGRMLAEEAAAVIGCRAHDIRTLILAGLLKPLGDPPANSIKYFAATHIHQLASDEKWLGKMTMALNDHWTEHNKKRKEKSDCR